VAILDLVAGHIQVGSLEMSTAIEHIKAGMLIPICILSAERVSELGDVPTLKELGFPELVTTTWFELAGPAGLPGDVVDAFCCSHQRMPAVPLARQASTNAPNPEFARKAREKFGWLLEAQPHPR
jgi:tripartite-type tricarboxylate transporter receptor subunit TctC